VRLRIIHGGQTGVDRGAAVSASDLKLPVAGWMPMDERDECGPIPTWARRGLKPLQVSGLAQRTTGNVVLCDLVLCIVEDRQHPYATPGTALTLQVARSIGRPRFAADAETPVDVIAQWVRDKASGAEVGLMVAGPRESKWPGAMAVTSPIISQLAGRLWTRGEPRLG
jgi:hypothetical protein